jgi:hypothetical protein
MNLSDINIALSLFVPIGLDEMDEVKLMNRLETKYVFSASRLTDLLTRLSGIYKVLEIDNLRKFSYLTTYLDTPDLLFYTQQVRGKLDRHKIRYRLYESTGISFLEIKKKTNKNRTIKWRIESSPDKFPDDKTIYTFIREYSPYSCSDLQPVLINGFTRITLVGKKFKERITFDYNLSFAGPDGKTTHLPFLAIAELKREKNIYISPFGIVMKQLGIKPNRFSKYCVGSALIKEMPRRNTLKPNLLQIKKIENEYFKPTGT